MKEHKIGDKINNWQILEILGRDESNNRLRCRAECKCGYIKDNYIMAFQKSQGCTKCGRVAAGKKNQKIPEKGIKINNWTVLDAYMKGIHCHVKVQCVCGEIKEKKFSDLKYSNKCFSCHKQKITSNLKRIRKGFGNLSGTYWTALKKGAIDRNLEFSITIEYLWELFEKQKGKCALSGIDIECSYIYTSKKEQTASVDRIDNSKGYIKGNVQWVHKDINNMKHAHDQTYFLKLCELITFNQKIN